MQLPPATRFQFKFFKRSSAKSGAKEIWETGIATYSDNREAIAPPCGTREFTIEGGDFRQAEQPHNPFRDNLGSPQGKKASGCRALVETINVNSPATRAFMVTHLTPTFAKSVPMEVFETAFAQRFARTGGMDLRGLRSYVLPHTETTTPLQDHVCGNWFATFVAFKDAADSRISAIGMQAAQSPKLPTITQEQLIADTRAILDRSCKTNIFSGTVLVSAEDKTLLEIACGDASKRCKVANKVANNIDTKFNLGSVKKMFIAVAVSQLVEKGKLSYTDTIDKYVDETWLPKSITSKITVHQLLSHTSGLGNYFNDKF